MTLKDAIFRHKNVTSDFGDNLYPTYVCFLCIQPQLKLLMQKCIKICEIATVFHQQ